MPVQRHYYLPRHVYTGQVAGVDLSYNGPTQQIVSDLGSATLKMLLEDAAVTAALQRGFSSVVIRSIPHSTTINSQRVRIGTALHITISAGQQAMSAHVELHGFNQTLGPNHWYDDVTHGPTKWEDRATSSNVSTPPRAQGEGSGGSGSRWIATGSTVEGQKWAWWDGTKYTGQYQ